MTELLSSSEWRRIERFEIGPRLSASSARDGRRSSPHRGAGMEFHEYRAYEIGDDVRDIDWGVYGRLDRLVVKRFRAEGQMSVHVLLDVSASMAFGEHDKLVFARRAAAAVARVAGNGHEPVGLTLVSDRLRHVLPPRRGRAQVARVLEHLAAASADGQSELTRGLTTYADMARSRGLAVVITDGFTPDGAREGLAYLGHKGFQVALIHVVADEELSPRLADAMELRDTEDPDEPPVAVNAAVIHAYRARVAAFVGDLEAFCLVRGFPYLPARSSMEFDAFVAAGIRCGLWHRQR